MPTVATAGTSRVHPVATLVRSPEAAVLRDEVAAWVTPHEVEPGGARLDGAVGIVPMRSTKLVFVRYGGSVVVEAPPTGDRVVACAPLGPMGVRVGARARSVEDVAFVLGRGERTLMQPDPWAGALVMAPDPRRLAEHREDVLGDEPAPEAPRAQARLVAQGCRAAWQAVTSLPESTPDEVVTSFLGAVEEQLLTAMVLAWHGTGSAPLPAGADSRLDELRAWLLEHHGVGIGVTDMARAVGLSVRQLQSVVHRRTGRTPTDLLREARLAAARERLAEADPATTTVAAIAHRSGYAHLGRFSVQYRERFGESPSATLRHWRP